jgi:hypothetical protein
MSSVVVEVPLVVREVPGSNPLGQTFCGFIRRDDAAVDKAAKMSTKQLLNAYKIQKHIFSAVVKVL